MTKSEQRLSVSEAAVMCGVGRTTVGYWVRSKKLYAQRQGRSYRIPVDDLVCFLQAEGQPVPPELRREKGDGPVFKSFKHCWQFHGENDGQHDCANCSSFQRQIDDCFCMRGDAAANCPYPCQACRYYRDVFLSRIRFIHQIGMPAAVFKGLYFWGANAAWAELCGLPGEKLIGLGVERVIHPSSLVVVISSFKRINVARQRSLTSSRIFVNTEPHGKQAIDTWILPLSEPEHTSLIVASPVGPGKSDGESDANPKNENRSDP
jgi:excisionase family DNA binding protein